MCLLSPSTASSSWVERLGLDAFDIIGEEVTEILERRPASLVVARVVKPKFRLKGRKIGEPIEVHTAGTPVLPIDRGQGCLRTRSCAGGKITYRSIDSRRSTRAMASSTHRVSPGERISATGSKYDFVRAYLCRAALEHSACVAQSIDQNGLVLASDRVALLDELAARLSDFSDMPELGIHPEDQARMFEGLQRTMQDGQLIVTTSAPAILRSVPAENVVLLRAP